MSGGYNKIFWGLIFANFHMNLNGIELLPAFIGYIIVYLGVETIAKEYGNNNLGKSSKLCSILALMSFLVYAIQLAMSENILINIIFKIIWINVFSVIEMIMVYKLLEGSREVLESNNYKYFKEYDRKISIYLKGMTTSIVMSNINMIFVSGILVFIGAVISLTLTIWILVIMRGLYRFELGSKTY